MKEFRFITTDILMQMGNTVEDFVEDAIDVATSGSSQATEALNDAKEALAFLRSIVEEIHDRRSR